MKSRRRLLQKHPLFTKDFFSTKSFGPGHLFGTAVLVLGVAGLAKIFVKRGREEADQARRGSPLPAWRPEEDPAGIENARGQYR